MTPKIKVIHINPFDHTVTEKRVESSLKSLQEMVQGLICVGMRFPNGDVLYVNDEGLFNAEWTSGRHAFFLMGAQQAFFGPGVIVGTTNESEDADCKTSVDSLNVAFARKRE